ncbi:CRE-MIG-10 protein [Caenorhabditis remanei]|uniref:CRE-MIG-10 protein n=1 Tax=Caenorhabditis remanei TaxID=31234 RepID=E3LT00_CAERE|nr:CRE-MIG-10 protein [Caenorhabditis remanei]
MESCEEECDLEIDSDEEEQLLGEKCISLLASLLPPSSSTLLNNAIHLELDEIEAPPPLFNLLEEQQFQKNCSEEEKKKYEEGDSEEDVKKVSDEEETEEPSVDNVDQETEPSVTMDTYDFPDPYPVQIRARPQVPPRPPIDTVRYSMNNIKESTAWELDELLEELEALETQLNSSSGGDQLLLGVSGIPSSSSRDHVKQVSTLPPPPPALSYHAHQQQQQQSQHIHHHHNTHLGYQNGIHQMNSMTTTSAASSCSSPDGDSAFGDSSSTESSNNRCRNSAFSSNDSCRDSLNTPSPTQVSPRNGELSAEETKALKIRQALEKMKEAKVTKIFVKFFVEDGIPLQMLIDERWTVADTLKQLAEKNHIALMEDHCIVEEFPELYIKRIYEDHEKVVENIQMWVQDSPNKLYFMRRPDKYAFISRPELYLLTPKTSDHMEIPAGDQWTIDVKQKFVHDYFNREPVVPPEMEGFLYLKTDGRKTWKKHYFVLRSSGLYYAPKSKKPTPKDLTCLMNLHSNQVYTGVGWEKKYKSPNPWCISIKLTALQIKKSQFAKYICAEDEMSFKKWLVALRIAKNGADLLQNFERACQIRRETLGPVSSMSAASSSTAISEVPNNLNMHQRTPSVASSIQLGSHLLNNQIPTRPLSVNVRNQSPASFSVNSSQPSQPSPSIISEKLEIQYDEQPTGTIKRAPLDVLRRVSRASTSSPTIPQEESDSDEEFPAPPPIVSAIRMPPPVTSPKPCTPLSAKKAPPPPPKRSENTKLQTATPMAPAKNDLEAALARRREKMASMEQ